MELTSKEIFIIQSKIAFLVVIFFVASIGGIASDIYAPSIIAISKNLNTPIDLVQTTMAIYMLGLSISQLIYGPLSDGFGRRPILCMGLLITLLGTGVCYFSMNIEALIFGRLIQGCGTGACAALWRSTFRDVFSGSVLAKYGSYLSICMVFVVPAAPAVGGYLQEWFSWRASFLFLGIYAFATLLLVLFFLKETSQHHHKSNLRISFIASSYWDLIKNRLFAGYSICAFLTYGAFFSWFAVGPVLIIDHLGYSPASFGWMSFAALGSAMGLGGFFNGRFVERLGTHRMLIFGWSTIFLSGTLLLIGNWLFQINMYAILVPVILFFLGSIFVFANTFAGAFAKCGKIAGFAGALYGAFQISGASVLGALISYLPDNNQLPLALVYMGCSALAWLVYKIVVRPAELESY